jgi:hypothetical protein
LIEKALGIKHDPFKKLRASLAVIGAASLFIIALFAIPPQQRQPQTPPATLFERVWKNDNPVQCGAYNDQVILYIYATGEQNNRKMRVYRSQYSNFHVTHYVIKSGVVYWWDGRAKKHGYKRYLRLFIADIEMKDFLDRYKEDYSHGILTCELWREQSDKVFELPSHIDFAVN